MIVLGVESSCDDTSAAVLDGNQLLSNVISTQPVHQLFGGVVPELASRQHVRNLIPVISEAFSRASITLNDIEGLAVTYGPGLAGSLLIGLSAVKGLAFSRGIPFVGINHLEGHIWANVLAAPDLAPPFVVLIASGGHTQIVRVDAWGKYVLLGRTRDDAAGEAFDKVAKLLGLGYPGGPFIEQKAAEGRRDAIRFPRAFLGKGSYDFSFSGLKTAVLTYVKGLGERETAGRLNDICAGFQEAVIEVLVEKTVSAAAGSGVETVCLAGGVAVNGALQQRMLETGREKGLKVLWPDRSLCTDNGGMIARAGAYYLGQGCVSSMNLAPVPSLSL